MISAALTLADSPEQKGAKLYKYSLNRDTVCFHLSKKISNIDYYFTLKKNNMFLQLKTRVFITFIRNATMGNI